MSSHETPEPPEVFIDWWKVAIGAVFIAVGVGFFVFAVRSRAGKTLYIVAGANVVLGLAKLMRGLVGYTRDGESR